MNECIRRLEEAEHMRRVAERDSRRAIEAAEKYHAEAPEKMEAQELAAERMTAAERDQRRCESWEQERVELFQSLGHIRDLQREAFARVTVLERQYEGRDEEMDSVLADSQDQRSKIAEACEKLLAFEKAEASHGADALSLQIQHMQGQIDNLQAQLFQASDKFIHNRSNLTNLCLCSVLV